MHLSQLRLKFLFDRAIRGVSDDRVHFTVELVIRLKNRQYNNPG